MTTTAAPERLAPTASRGIDSPTARGLAMMLTSGTSSQTGAAIGSHAFDSIGPAGVVAVRQLITAAVLLPTVRPDVRRFTWAQWWPTLLLAMVFGSMNLTLYTAVDRIGLGLAVTLEFLGPLAVALCQSRRRIDLACAFGAAAGVYVLVLPSGSTDYFGVAMGLIAAACWAAYILLNRVVGQRLPGLQGTATASAVSATVFLPLAIGLVLAGKLTGLPLLYAMTAGLMSSLVPFTLDVKALRLVPSRFFAVFMSVHPALAAFAGLVILNQVPDVHELVGIGIVIATNVVAVSTLQPRTDQASRTATGRS